MKSNVARSVSLIVVLCAASLAMAQTAAMVPAGAVPKLINYSGVLKDSSGKTLTSITGVTFLIYAEEQDGSPLWLETQNVQPDARGNYTAQLGATKPGGIPLDMFSSGEARWLALVVNGGEEQPRVLLVAVPYALKAADAETVGGLPASAFVLANKPMGAAPATSTKNSAPPANTAVTGKGVVDFIPMWDSASDIVDSVIFQKSSQIGIGTTSPVATLDVNGKGDVRDTLTLFPKGTDPTLAISGTTFKVDQTGKMTFVSGQTFPGTGTITNVAAGTDLTGGGTKGKVTLNLDTTKVPLLAAANVFTNNQAISGGPSTWGLTVSQPNYLTILEQGPESGVGTALEMQTTGTGGMFWQILNTGAVSSQGANKLNFRNDSAGVDVMTLTASGQVGIGTTSPTATLDVQGSIATSGNVSQARSAGGMVFISPTVGILQCFNSTLSGAAATTPPCGFNFINQGTTGTSLVDFGFQVDDRFLSATTSSASDPTVISVCTDTAGAGVASPTSLRLRSGKLPMTHICNSLSTQDTGSSFTDPPS